MAKVLVSQASQEWAHQLDDLKERWLMRREGEPFFEYKRRPRTRKIEKIGLEDVKDKPHVTRVDVREARHMPIDVFCVRIRELEEDTLHLMKLELDEISNDIGYQLDVAKARVYKSGEYSDPNWFHGAQAVKRSVSRHVQAIQNEFGRRKRERQKTRPLAQFFMDVAHDDLPPETFESFMERAKARMMVAYEELLP